MIPVDITAAKRRVLASTPAGRRTFFRHLAPGLIAPQVEIAKLAGIDRLTATAMYCDLYGLPQNFFPAAHRLARQGGYALTHAVLALVMVRGNKCIYDKVAYRRELLGEIEMLRAMLQNISVTSDLGIEAILMLQLSRKSPDMAGEPSHINPLWIDHIIAAQSADGSWYQNDHTTVLALWLLLEMKNN